MCLLSFSLYAQNSTNVVEFKNIQRSTPSSTSKQATAYMDITETTVVKFQLWLSGDIYNGQYGRFEIGHNVFIRDQISPSREVSVTLRPGRHYVKILLDNIRIGSTGSTMKIVETSTGVLGRSLVLQAD